MSQITVKIKLVIFGVIDDALVVFAPNNALPTAALTQDKSLDVQVEELFLGSTGSELASNYSEQLYSITGADDEVVIAYYILLPLISPQQTAGWEKAAKAFKNTPDAEIVMYAVQRLRWKIEYTNVVYSLLPMEFTLSELQKTYEAILGQVLDKRNFRKKILSLKFLDPTKKRRFGISRPAQIYTFKQRVPSFIKIFS